jgi:hypothetical protein
MKAARIDELTIREQLSLKRNLLFQEFLQNPVNVGLVNEIRSIDARIAELTTDFRADQKSAHD